MNKEHINVIRVIPLLVIAAATIILSCVLGLMKEIYWDTAACVAFVDMLYLLVLLFELEYQRKNRMIANNIATTFSRIAICYVVCCLIGVLFLFCPEFFLPVMLFPLLMCAVGNEFLGISTGMFLVTLYAMIFEASSYEVAAYMFMVLLAGGLAKTLTKKEYRRYVSLLLFCVSLIVPFVFYYLNYQKFDRMNYAYGAVSGLITGLAACFLIPVLYNNTEKGLENRLLDIISDEYSEVKRLKHQFPEEYAHAKKVSEISMHAAEYLGLRVPLCGAAGFYYRMGKWGGGDYGDSGVERAQLLNFPYELIRIIYEYNGEEALPSTPESAVIHMVDALTLHLEALGPDVAQSTWNREMIIYQTLNEFSTSGLYDQSGLSMNLFLKARTFLVKEKLLQ
jgi:hypothetical protein